MPNLCIIPFRALQDERLSPADLRVLCAIGAHTDRDGAGVWASAKTLASEGLVSRSQFFASIKTLEWCGYIRRTARYSDTGSQLTSMVSILLDPPPVQELLDSPRPEATGPKRPQKQRPQKKDKARVMTTEEWQGIRDLYDYYPKRDGENPFHPAQRAVLALLRAGVTFAQMRRAIDGYTKYLQKTNSIGTQFVRTMGRFFGEDYWRTYDEVRVFGLTRDEWRTSGQDMAEFDRQLNERTTLPQEEDDGRNGPDARMGRDHVYGADILAGI